MYTLYILYQIWTFIRSQHLSTKHRKTSTNCGNQQKSPKKPSPPISTTTERRPSHQRFFHKSRQPFGSSSCGVPSSRGRLLADPGSAMAIRGRQGYHIAPPPGDACHLLKGTVFFQREKNLPTCNFSRETLAFVGV